MFKFGKFPYISMISELCRLNHHRTRPSLPGISGTCTYIYIYVNSQDVP